MITNYFIPPHPQLQPFVDSYFLCSSKGEKMMLKSAWPASNETSLIFYMVDQPYHYTSEHVASPLQHDRGCIVGLQSHCNGIVYFNGIYYTFIIQFKANGFSKLLRLPVAEFINKLYYSDEILGKASKSLNEELQYAKDIQQMTHFADKFLLHFLNRQKAHLYLHDGITYISNELFANNTILSIEQYAYKANMSVRNFGRKFTEQVGVSPKLYCRLLRFNNAVNTKLKHPQAAWTSIAYECGYYDQMHMIKDFKEFANLNPSALFQNNTEFIKPRMEVAGSVTDRLDQSSAAFSKEEFVMVKRNVF